ncbi:acyl carrier protein [Rheinheimera baltica]|uniref:acyl carrier protein n=1 Tax=Rheinheimera baltica TaxID=67576 RepID=UPI00273F403C|nr:acyl carrier protein [Rheinheimera baltica]MDP5191499.1 acyl carrier protein [Rheinheimera baltica]
MNQSHITKDTIVKFVLEKVALRTKKAISDLHGDTQLADVGVDSLNAVLICGYLEDEYELEIEPMMMFQHKTANQVAAAIYAMLQER